MKKFVVIGLLCAMSFEVLAQKTAWEDPSHRVKMAQEVRALGDDFAGDRIQVANGALSFVVTDVSLPGSNGLAVEFTRRYQVKNRKGTLTDEMLADWEVEIPSISGTFATDWVAGGAVPGNRCSVVGLPPRLPIPADSEGYQYSDYWGGADNSLA